MDIKIDKNGNVIIPQKDFLKLLANQDKELSDITVPKTFKLYKHVLDAWNGYITNHVLYKGEKIQDHINRAILEYMERHP